MEKAYRVVVVRFQNGKYLSAVGCNLTSNLHHARMYKTVAGWRRNEEWVIKGLRKKYGNEFDQRHDIVRFEIKEFKQ